ncbi:MAG: SRPBCC family protein [Planctomycetes bacterium]|nr:SRPBCC family protein [Planctomycetota bacterium]
MKTWRLRSSSWIPRPPEAVFPFFADARNLELLTPTFLRFAVLTPAPIEMREGAHIDYRITIRGVPLRWRTRIARWQPPSCFVDEQLRGPYSVWHHTHTFTPADGGTLLGDEVVMRPKGGPLAPLVMALFVRRDVERIFRFRGRVMAERFGAPASSPARIWWDEPSPPRAAKAPTAGEAP